MSKILFAVSGSIAAMKAAQTVSSLVQNRHEVQVVTTPSGLKFVGAATWEGLSGRAVISDIFAEGHQMDHIHLARWADLYVLCPATANAIANWAHGLACDLPSALFLAFERAKPILVAPAMNREMWKHPSVQTNLAQLRSWQVKIIEPEEGNLACGETGMGRLASPAQTVAAIECCLRPTAKGHLLVTAGATREPIDDIRFLSNVSTGRTGATLADFFSAQGWQVTYLHGPTAKRPTHADVKSAAFSDFDSLQAALRSRLQETRFDFIVHAAAVSDFSVSEITGCAGAPLARVGGKLSSDQDLYLKLRKNQKLVLNLKEWSRPHQPNVIAFKLTDTDNPIERQNAIASLLDRPEVDAVVWNNLGDVRDDSHSGKILTKDEPPIAFSNKTELAEKLAILMQLRMPKQRGNP